MTQSYKEAFRRLYEMAETQQGFFTAKPAKAAGFAENTHPYHVSAGNWIREYRGIYRLALFPPAEHPDLALWALWSRNRDEEVEGVYSTRPLSVVTISQTSILHMSVPVHFRRNSEIPGALILHYADLPQGDVETARGFKFTRSLRTILDLPEADAVPRRFLQQALRQTLSRGLINRPEVRRVNLPEPARKLFGEMLHTVAE